MTDFASPASPDVQASFQALIDAGKEYEKFAQVARPFIFKAMGSGYPLLFSTLLQSPFRRTGGDAQRHQGDYDGYVRHPDKVLAPVTGTPEQVKKRCHELIEICAPGGGYILCPGAAADEIKLENLKAMVEDAREYGVYQK